MNKHIQEHMAGAQAKIAWLLALEAQPFSLNTHYFTDYRSKFIAYYRGQRQRYARPELSPAVEAFTNKRHAESNAGGTGFMTSASEAVKKLMAAFAELSIDVTPAQLQKILAEDTMEPALCIMADVRAYFQGVSTWLQRNINTSADPRILNLFYCSRVQALCGHSPASN